MSGMNEGHTNGWDEAVFTVARETGEVFVLSMSHLGPPEPLKRRPVAQ
jgi:hypothetical protein